MREHEMAYNMWPLVILNSAVFILFVFTLMRPKTGHDWQCFGITSAFLVVLFVEMYGSSFTIYFLSSWVGSRYPGLDPFARDVGNLWWALLEQLGSPRPHAIRVLSDLIIGAGFGLLAVAWTFLYDAQRCGVLATQGPYACVRHPQYGALILAMLGFFMRWPTLPTLVMLPMLVVMYVRLAHEEDVEAAVQFGRTYRLYAAQTPAFLPGIRRRCTSHQANAEGK